MNSRKMYMSKPQENIEMGEMQGKFSWGHKNPNQTGVVAHTCNLSFPETAEAGSLLQGQGQLRLENKTLAQNNK